MACVFEVLLGGCTAVFVLLAMYCEVLDGYLVSHLLQLCTDAVRDCYRPVKAALRDNGYRAVLDCTVIRGYPELISPLTLLNILADVWVHPVPVGQVGLLRGRCARMWKHLSLIHI